MFKIYAGHSNTLSAGYKISRPQGGYALWVELGKNVNAFELYQAAIEQNISIAPGQIFSIDGRYTNFIRISFGLAFDNVVEESFKVLGTGEQGYWKLINEF